jgi:hypothetical protein
VALGSPAAFEAFDGFPCEPLHAAARGRCGGAWAPSAASAPSASSFHTGDSGKAKPVP